MPRQTRKFVEAVKVANLLKLPTSNAEFLYSALARTGHRWDPDQGVWYEATAKTATVCIQVRVWADAAQIDRVSKGVIQAMSECGLHLALSSKATLQEGAFLVFREEKKTNREESDQPESSL